MVYVIPICAVLGFSRLFVSITILFPQNQCLLKSCEILPSPIPLQFSPVEKIFSQVETHANTTLQPNIRKKRSSEGSCSLWSFVFLCPYIKSDSIFIEMTPPVIISDVIKACFDIINAGGNHVSNVKWHQNLKNDTCATSISCQMDVNRRILLCDRIEIRIREVISDKMTPLSARCSFSSECDS